MLKLRCVRFTPALVCLVLANFALAATTTVYNSTGLQSTLSGAKPGDHIFMAPGTYTGSIYIDTNSGGTPTSPIVVAALNPTNPPVFNLGTGSIQTVHMDNLVLDGLTLNTTAVNGVQIQFGHNVVLKNFYNVNTGTGSGNSAIKFTGCNNFLMYNVSTVCWGICGVDMVGSAQGLFMNNHIANTLNPSSLGVGIQAKGGSYGIGMYNNVMTDAGYQAINFGGDTGTQYFHQGNLSLGWENYDSVAMGNTFVRGSYPVNFANSTNDIFAYNTVVNPSKAFLRILQMSGAVSKSTCNGQYSHNLVQYGSVLENVNQSNGVSANTFTFDSNYWYSTAHPSSSIPTMVGTQTNNAGGADPQLDANYKPQYGPAKAYGANAPGMKAAWLAQVNKFQWAWDTAQSYAPQACLGGSADASCVTLDATASSLGVNSYGSNTLPSYGWDINGDGIAETTGANPVMTITCADLASQYGIGQGMHSFGLILSVTNELGTVMTSDETFAAVNVPEPITLVLLGAGGLAMLRRRK